MTVNFVQLLLECLCKFSGPLFPIFYYKLSVCFSISRSILSVFVPVDLFSVSLTVSRCSLLDISDDTLEKFLRWLPDIFFFLLCKFSPAGFSISLKDGLRRAMDRVLTTTPGLHDHDRL